MFGGAKFDPEKLKKLEEGFEFLNTFLQGQQWVAGPNITVADYAIVATVSTADVSSLLLCNCIALFRLLKNV